MANKKKILFICKHNMFRSRVAEEYMKKNSDYDLSSAGLIMAEGSTSSSQRRAAMKFGLDISKKSRTLSINLLREQDLVVVVAKDVPREIFENPLYKLKGKLIFWNIRDVNNLASPSERNSEEIIGQIIKKADVLIKELQIKKW